MASRAACRPARPTSTVRLLLPIAGPDAQSLALSCVDWYVGFALCIWTGAPCQHPDRAPAAPRHPEPRRLRDGARAAAHDGSVHAADRGGHGPGPCAHDEVRLCRRAAGAHCQCNGAKPYRIVCRQCRDRPSCAEHSSQKRNAATGRMSICREIPEPKFWTAAWRVSPIMPVMAVRALAMHRAPPFASLLGLPLLQRVRVHDSGPIGLHLFQTSSMGRR